jgi:hypothetical protein
MTREESTRQLGERLLARQTRRARRAIGEQGVGEFPSAICAAADHAFELRMHRQHRQSKALDGHTAAREVDAKIAAREVRTIAEDALEDGGGARAQASVEFQPAEVMRHDATDARRGELEHPADVVASHEVPRRPHDMRAQQSSCVDGASDVGVS